MVGLDKFKEAFSQYSDNCVIIGGTACEIVMRGTAIRPRATHDVDMIVVVERMTPNSVNVFGILFLKADIVRKNTKFRIRDIPNINYIVLSTEESDIRR